MNSGKTEPSDFMTVFGMNANQMEVGQSLGFTRDKDRVKPT
jgi:hypothetical protein